MSGPTSNDTHILSKLKIDAPHALANIRYNSVTAADEGTSSENEVSEPQAIPADDAREAIGISIGHEQTRLTSPKTPAVEKAAVIEKAGGFFGDFDGVEDGILVEEPEEHEDEGKQKIIVNAAYPESRPHTSGQSPRSEVPERSPSRTSIRLPSPWRAEASTQWQGTGKVRSGLVDGILFNRRRSSSGPQSMLEGWQKSLLSSLPSMPRQFSLTSHFSSSQDKRLDAVEESAKESKKSSVASSPLVESSDSTSPLVVNRQRSGSDSRISGFAHKVSPREPLRNVSPLQPVGTRSSLLRRSTSDQSLVTQRTLSMAESLGDDSRFEHVQDQVNSRFKAIRDSWQDSNIKLPSMPNFNVSSLTPDFIRERSGSLNRKYNFKRVPDQAQGSDVLSTSERSEKPLDPITRQPYASAKAAVSDATTGKPLNHPVFSRALERLEGDVVVLGGYRGSILRSAEPPNRQLWVPVKVGLNLRKADLELGLEEEDDECADSKIIAGGMLTHIGPVDIARRLFKRLRSCENTRHRKLRVHDYGYDWRLHPTHLSRQLIAFLEDLPCNKPGLPKERRGATVIAHSLGGLITRHAVNQRPELFKGVVYAGVPTTCVNILGPMRNGDDVLLSRRVLTAQVNFTIRTSFALLPLDGECFFDKETKEPYPVDFFDPQHWIEYKWSPCVGRPLPPLNPQPKATGITGYVSSMANILPSLSLPGRKGSSTALRSPLDSDKATMARGVAEPNTLAMNAANSDHTRANGNADSDEFVDESSSSVSTAVTIPREKAIAYLERTLKTMKKFKQELAFHPKHAASNAYPPVAVIYGKSTPTVYGAKVNGREGISRADAYDQLAFASGDGVVLARAAMVPEGYTTARGGIVSSDRGHVTLLGDLEAVGKCLNAIAGARKKGIGYGP